MQTVLQLLNRAYSKIQVKSKYESLDSDQEQEGIDELNEMMWEFDAEGLNVGWADVATTTENVPAPDWLLGTITNGVSIRVAPYYGVQIDPRVIGMFEKGLNAAYKRLVPIPKLRFPNIMPVGGSRHRYQTDIYFSNPNRDALSYQGGFIRDENSNVINSDQDSDNGTTNES